MNTSINSISTIPTEISSMITDDAEAILESRIQGINTLISFLLLLTVLMALIGNILVVVAVFLSHRLRDEMSNLFIINLSITDLSSASIVMTSSTVAVAHDSWPMGGVWCSIVCGSNYCFIIVSMLTLCFISLDRYVAIHHSLRYYCLVTKKRILILIIYTWLQGFLFGLVPILYGWIDYDYWEATCAIQWHLHGNPVLIYVIIAFIVCFLLPGIVLIAAYCKIFTAAKKIKSRPSPAIAMSENGDTASQASGAQTISQQSPSRVKSGNAKVLRSLLIVVLAYIICMTPFSVTKLYKVINPVADALPGYANIVATFFQFLSSAVNPLIYGLFREDFRKAFKVILWRLFHQRNVHNSASSSF